MYEVLISRNFGLNVILLWCVRLSLLFCALGVERKMKKMLSLV